MNRIYRWAVEGLVVCALGIGATFVGRASSVAAPSAPQVTTPQRDLERRSSETDSSANLSLASNLDAMRDAVLLAAMRGADAQPVAPVDPVVQASETLYQRLVNAPPDPQSTLQMERALQALIDTGVLKDAGATFVCGAAMCRIELVAREDTQVEAATTAFTAGLPKLFASAVAHPDGTGKMAVFAAKRSADLRHSEIPEGDAGVENEAAPKP